MAARFDQLTNSLLAAAVNVAFAAVAFVSFIFPRFTNVGGRLCLVILLLVVVDIVLVLRDLFRSGTRIRAIVAMLLWLPLVFLFGMIMQWEGPLYVAASGNPPVLQLRGLAGVCTVDIYGPEQENAEWSGDDIGKLWSIKLRSINHTARFPLEVKFKYGDVPVGFEQVSPGIIKVPQPLDPSATYKLVVGRCMGGPQYLSLRGHLISEYKPDPNECWGELKVPERRDPAYVRVDCKTRQPLPMSDRAKERLKEYRENRIPVY
jgi:hypothetical protein